MLQITVLRDPNALYAAAIGALHLSPEVQAVFSPVGAQLFTAAYGAAVGAGGAAVSEIGSAALEAAVSAVGPTVVAEVSSVAGAVAGAVGDAIPVVNMFVSIVQVLTNPAFAATGSNTDQQDCAFFWSQMPGASGPSDPVTGNTATTPADIFSSSDAVTGRHIPNSALGACIAAITEIGPGDEDDAISPAGNLHTEYGLRQLTSVFKNLFPGPTSASVGLLPASHAVYRSLRLAAGSNGPDHGTIPYALLMDLLAGDLDAGRLNVTFIAFLLNSYIEKQYVGDPAAGNFVPMPRQSVCGGGPAQAMASQIVALIQAWKATRAKIPKAMMKITFSPLFGLLLAAKSNPRKALENSAFTCAARLAVHRRAFDDLSYQFSHLKRTYKP